MFRLNGYWFVVAPKPGEPPRLTHHIMWNVAKGVDAQKAYREWYAKERKITSVLYPIIPHD
jgi:hypothetical protein